MIEVIKRVDEYVDNLSALNLNWSAIDPTIDKVIDQVVYRGRFFFVTRHKDEDGIDCFRWRTCDSRLNDMRDVDPPKSWRTHDFSSFALRTDDKFPPLIVGRRGELAILDIKLAETANDFRFVEAKNIVNVESTNKKYFVAPVYGSCRLFCFDRSAWTIDKQYDPSIKTQLSIGDDVKTVHVKSSVVTRIDYAYASGSVFLVATHEQCGERFESWRRLSYELDCETVLVHPIDWTVGNTKRVSSEDQTVNGLTVEGCDGRILKYQPKVVNNTLVYDMC